MTLGLTIDDLRICPALAGPDDVAMLLREFDRLGRLLAQSLRVADIAIAEWQRLSAEQGAA